MSKPKKDKDPGAGCSDKLRELANCVESGEPILATALRDAVGLTTSQMIAIGWAEPDAAKSLDAAKALHDAVLPNWKFMITEETNGRFTARVTDVDWMYCLNHLAKAKTPAAAWVSAILKAKGARQTSGERDDV